MLSAPAPKNPGGRAKSTTSLHLYWDLVPISELGQTLSTIIGYRLEVTKYEDGSLETKQNAGPSSASRDIYMLGVYTKYCFQIQVKLSSNVLGNKTDPFCLYTDESSTYCSSGYSMLCLNHSREKPRGVVTVSRF